MSSMGRVTGLLCVLVGFCGLVRCVACGMGSDPTHAKGRLELQRESCIVGGYSVGVAGVGRLAMLACMLQEFEGI